MKSEMMLKKIAYIAVVLYILDIVFWGGGNLTKIGGVSTRMVFFAIAVLACVPGMLKNIKQYITNKYCLIVGGFMLFLVVSLVVGVINGNSRMIMSTDIKGFLNILIVFPMIYVLDTEDKIKSLLKIMIVGLLIITVVALGLSFYALYPTDVQDFAYEFFNSNVLCGLSSLYGNVTRVFFHTAGRLFFVGFMFLWAFSVINTDKRIGKEIGLAALMCACFISYTRSVYFAIFVCFVAFIVCVITLFKEKSKIYFMGILRMSIITLIFIFALGITQGENLVEVAINRCLLATMEIDEPVQTADNSNKTDKKNTKKDKEKKDKTKVEEDFNNIKAEKSNLEIRELRKKLAIKNIKKHPVFGNGLGVVNDINGEHIEYFYLDLLSKIGVIGTLIFFMPFIFCVYDLIKYRKQMKEINKILLFSANISILFLFVISYFNPCMNTNVGLVVYSLGMSIAVRAKADIVIEKHK